MGVDEIGVGDVIYGGDLLVRDEIVVEGSDMGEGITGLNFIDDGRSMGGTMETGARERDSEEERGRN